MAKIQPRQLVIDADVACSSSEKPDTIPSACRGFLKTVLEVRHHVVMTDTISKEWHNHKSIYSRKWRKEMYARKLVKSIKVDEDETLREKIAAALHWDHREAAEKDAHLIEAAIATDRLVTSRDEKVRRLFGSASVAVGQLRQIVWVNPTKADEKPIDWLRNGARAEAHRQLGN